IPAYLILVMGGLRALWRVWPAALVCGLSFSLVQFVVSNFIGPYLTDILSSLAAIASLVALLQVWNPAGIPRRESQYRLRETASAWSPYLLLVAFILLWSFHGIGSFLNRANVVFAWPGLHNVVQQAPPAVAHATPYPAIYRFRY